MNAPSLNSAQSIIRTARPFPALVLGVLLSALSCQNPGKTEKEGFSQGITPPGFAEQIDSVVAGYQALDLFSGVVLVAGNGKKIYHKAFGLANRGTGRLNDTTTLFDIGSMNKTFTGIVVKQLMAEGRLSLSDKLDSIIPGFQDPRVAQVTVGQLLDHRSGFGDYHSPGYFELPLEQRSLQAIVERAKLSRLEFDPGAEDQPG